MKIFSPKNSARGATAVELVSVLLLCVAACAVLWPEPPAAHGGREAATPQPAPKEEGSFVYVRRSLVPTGDAFVVMPDGSRVRARKPTLVILETAAPRPEIVE